MKPPKVFFCLFYYFLLDLILISFVGWGLPCVKVFIPLEQNCPFHCTSIKYRSRFIISNVAVVLGYFLYDGQQLNQQVGGISYLKISF
jgi:hypothetical protein